jgi:hypothetical protein
MCQLSTSLQYRIAYIQVELFILHYRFLQHVVPDWDEYEDTLSGRHYFYNRVTKEKSWKPPRKQRLNDSSSSNVSQPTSPVPDQDPKEDSDPVQTVEKPKDVSFCAFLRKFESLQKSWEVKIYKLRYL